MRSRIIKIINIFSIILFVALFFYNNKITKDEKIEKSMAVENNSTSEIPQHKNYTYYELLKILKDTNNNFKIEKINKDNSQTNNINFVVTYNGDINQFFSGIKYLRDQEMVCSINKINIVKDNNYNFNAEMDINLYKYK